MVMPSLSEPAGLLTQAARLHSSSSSPRPHVTIMLRAGQGYSAAACLALTDGDPAMRVLRRERGARIVRDAVLDGSGASRPKWLGHWLIRLAALHGGLGLTTALILDGELRPELLPSISALANDGAWIRCSPCKPHHGESQCS